MGTSSVRDAGTRHVWAQLIKATVGHSLVVGLFMVVRIASASPAADVEERGTQAYETTLNNCIARMARERTSYLPRIAEVL